MLRNGMVSGDAVTCGRKSSTTADQKTIKKACTLNTANPLKFKLKQQFYYFPSAHFCSLCRALPLLYLFPFFYCFMLS